jgi:esterase/lipase superfamily enzyme
VWYGTNRRPSNPANEALGYSSGRDKVIHYGTAYVHVPQSHEFGSVGSWWITRVFTRSNAPLELEEIEPFNAATFFTRLAGTIRSRVEPGDVLVYLHGYNTTFEQAAIRAAQIGFDLKIPGAVAFFSWPSGGGPLGLVGYNADRASIEASEAQIEEFLTRILTESGAARVHILAHSMGNLGLLRCLQRISQSLITKGLRFGQIFLAAPDIDRDLFTTLAAMYPSVSTRTTLYVSSKDLALKASSILSDFPRAGYYPPVTVIPKIDTVRVSSIDVSILGHGYYAEAAAVLYDIYSLIRRDDGPTNRLRLKAVTESGLTFWDMTR